MTRVHLERIGLTLRTARNLSWRQVLHRVRLRTQRALLYQLPWASAAFRRQVSTGAGWPVNFVPLDALVTEAHPSAEVNAQAEFVFLNEAHALGDLSTWEPQTATQLWRYHLHYFEWGWSFVRHPDRGWARHEFTRLWTSWKSGTVFGRWDAWSPYVASLRAWSLCGVYSPLVKGTSEEEEFLHLIGLHLRFIRAHLEFDVGGNHLLKNLKALLGLSIFVRDEEVLSFALAQLERQIAIQVLDDGGHFERSPSYHCQVLGDLIDIRGLLQSRQDSAPAWLAESIDAMQRWLGAMLLPDGDVPLFNDCTLVGAERLALLGPILPPRNEPLICLRSSGYVVAKPSSRIHVVMDVGLPCPPELPAHAHADCLSFVMSLDGQRLLVDTGTSTYDAGERRDYERSTRAHNTIDIDGADQTEVWGAFRAALRARPTLEMCEVKDGAIVVAASHDGYRRLKGAPRHRRFWRLSPQTLEIHDEISGDGYHSIGINFHCAPGVSVEMTAIGRMSISHAGPPGMEFATASPALGDGCVSCQFGASASAGWLRGEAEGLLPLTWVTRFEAEEIAVVPADVKVAGRQSPGIRRRM